jgi:hypothetical protein
MPLETRSRPLQLFYLALAFIGLIVVLNYVAG